MVQEGPCGLGILGVERGHLSLAVVTTAVTRCGGAIDAEFESCRSQLYCGTVSTNDVDRGQIRNFAVFGFSGDSFVRRMDVECHFTTLF